MKVTDEPSSFGELCISAISIKLSPQRTSIWRAMFVITLWHIWKSGNIRIFEDRKETPRRALVKIWATIWDINKLHDLGHMYNTQEELLILHALRIPGKAKKPPDIIPVRWSSPPAGWIKCNTDGSARGSLGEATCGDVFRTSSGFVKGCFSLSIGIAFAFETELLAAILAIEIAHEKNWRKLWLECDSTYVVQMFRARSLAVPWKLATRWSNMFCLLKEMEVIITHIYREGNTVADALASIRDANSWWTTAPEAILPMLGRDMSLLSYYRFGR